MLSQRHTDQGFSTCGTRTIGGTTLVAVVFSASGTWEFIIKIDAFIIYIYILHIVYYGLAYFENMHNVHNGKLSSFFCTAVSHRPWPLSLIMCVKGALALFAQPLSVCIILIICIWYEVVCKRS